MLRYVKFHSRNLFNLKLDDVFNLFRLLGLQLASNNFPRYQGTPSHRPGCHLVLRKARAFVVELDAFLGTSRFWRARARSSAWTCSVRPHLSGWNGINPYPSPRCMRLKWISLQGTWNYSICCAPPWVEWFHTILWPWYWTMLCPSSRGLLAMVGSGPGDWRPSWETLRNSSTAIRGQPRKSRVRGLRWLGFSATQKDRKVQVLLPGI